MDELAFSLDGAKIHDGMPVNPATPDGPQQIAHMCSPKTTTWSRHFRRIEVVSLSPYRFYQVSRCWLSRQSSEIAARVL